MKSRSIKHQAFMANCLVLLFKPCMISTLTGENLFLAMSCGPVTQGMHHLPERLKVNVVLAVLLDQFDRAVVADIGLGKMANAESTIASGRTLLWASPEQRLVR